MPETRQILGSQETVSQVFDSAQLDRMFRALRRDIDNAPEEGWEDIPLQIISRGVGVNDPTWSVISGGDFSAFKFGVNDQIWAAVHIRHDIVRNTDLFFHIHWMTDGTIQQPVKWEWTYTAAKGFNQDNFASTGTVISAEETPPGSALRHMTTEAAGQTITDVSEPDTIIYLRMRRITNGAVENTDGVFMLISDVHYRSTGKTTPGKAPDFYTR